MLSRQSLALSAAVFALFTSPAIAAAAAPGGSPRPDRARPPIALTFSGLGNVRLGMTVTQVRKIDRSLRITSKNLCTFAETRNAGLLVFNPAASGGRLAFIEPRKNVPTAAGLRVGDTYAKARKLYGFTRRSVDTNIWDNVLVSPDYRKRRGAESAGGRFPHLGVGFTEDGRMIDETRVDITRARVQKVFLNGGQNCFS